MLKPFIFFSLLVAIAGCQSSSDNADADVKRYTNPVLNRDFPDPTVIRGGDGWFYAYATQTFFNNTTFNIQVAKSKDLSHWSFVGDALPQKPTWADSTQDFWAPHVLYDSTDKTYYMYYSGESDSPAFGKCLGVATSKNPEGPFVDKGTPLLCGRAFENIDPMAFDDPVSGKKLLYWGSDGQPIRVQELDADRQRFKDGTAAKDVVRPGKDVEYSNLVEGAWVVYRDKYYYLFYSGDNCCGDKAHYAVLVARAAAPEGPFTRLGQAKGNDASTILVKNSAWTAPGHNSIITDDAGQDWIFYHAVSTTNPKGRVMLMDRVTYTDGWPTINGNSPSGDSTTAPEVNP